MVRGVFTCALTATLGVAAWSVWSFGDPFVASARTSGGTSVDERQHEILRQDIDASGDPVLSRMYSDISTKYFHGTLQPIPVIWEPRLAEVGSLAPQKFTLEGMFGHLGRRAMILLNPDLRADARALERALCHEIVHAYLYARGESTTSHGNNFQVVLRQLSEAGAFEGVVATPEGRARLRAWLDAESARLDDEESAIGRMHEEIDADRAALEREQSVLGDVASVNMHRAAYNARATDANARVDRYNVDRTAYDQALRRYNLMLVYPDGLGLIP
jgi:predicted SprT family Zn-dependent metalloprotease